MFSQVHKISQITVYKFFAWKLFILILLDFVYFGTSGELIFNHNTSFLPYKAILMKSKSCIF